MPIVADAAIAIRGDMSGFQSDLKGAEAQTRTLGQRVAGAFSPRNLAAFGAAAGGVAAVLSPIATAADDAFDSIRAGTGATGDALDALQEDFKAVAGSVPDNVGVVAQVLADVNTRTGATGEALQGLTETILDFSRATGTDAVQNVALATRVFGDWQIATEDQVGTLDMFLRASQQTGIGVDRLQASLVRFGAPLRQMGFSLDEATVLLGKFEKEGVNADLVMGSLRIALGKMAREGEEAPETFRRVVAEIERLGPSAEATAMAMELFGARAGADMAAAIQEGRFEVGELFDLVANGSETVQSVTADTEDLADGFKGFLNSATLALGEFAGPLAGFSEIAGPMLYTLPLLTSGIGAFAGMIMKTAVPALLTIGKVLLGLIAGTGPVGLVITAIGALFLAWQTNFLGIRDIVSGAIDFIGGVFTNAIGWFGGLWDAIAGAIGAAVDVIKGVIGSIAGVVSTVVDAVAGLFNFITGGTAKANRELDNTAAKTRQAQASWSPSTYVDRSASSWEQQRRQMSGYATGAWNIPMTGPAFLHAGEMVLPASVAQWFRQGGLNLAGVSGGDTYNVYVPEPLRERSVAEIGAGLERLGRMGKLPSRRK
jgi:phage-related protein